MLQYRVLLPVLQYNRNDVYLYCLYSEALVEGMTRGEGVRMGMVVTVVMRMGMARGGGEGEMKKMTMIKVTRG